jgi:pimeloyl-ACP methyl ester carboxylesterase
MRRVIYFLAIWSCVIVHASANGQQGWLQSSGARKMRRHHLTEVVLKFNNGEEGHCWVSHQGKPKLLLLHGITGNAEVQYGRNAAHLCKNFDVIALDLKFHGESKNNPNGFSIEDQVNWVSDCLMLLAQQYNDESFTRVHVIGNSYGGIVAGIFADHYPQMVMELTLVDAPIRFFTSSMADSIAKEAGVNHFFDLLSPQDVKTFRKRTALALYRKIWIPKSMAKSIIEGELKEKRNVHWQLVESLQNSEEYWNNYEIKWKCKVHLFWGEADELIPLEVGQRQGAYFKNATFKVLPKVGHVWNMERPRQFNRWVEENEKNVRVTINPSF